MARTGPKSTNQSLKVACAIASSVAFWRRLSFILSSSVPRIWAIACCSEKGGNESFIFRNSLCFIPVTVVPVDLLFNRFWTELSNNKYFKKVLSKKPFFPRNVTTLCAKATFEFCNCATSPNGASVVKTTSPCLGNPLRIHSL